MVKYKYDYLNSISNPKRTRKIKVGDIVYDSVREAAKVLKKSNTYFGYIIKIKDGIMPDGTKVSYFEEEKK